MNGFLISRQRASQQRPSIDSPRFERLSQMARDVSRPAMGQVLTEQIKAGREFVDRNLDGLAPEGWHTALKLFDDGGGRERTDDRSALLETVEHCDNFAQQLPLEFDGWFEIGVCVRQLAPAVRGLVDQGSIGGRHVRSV
jgi:hypothetical protein